MSMKLYGRQCPSATAEYVAVYKPFVNICMKFGERQRHVAGLQRATTGGFWPRQAIFVDSCVVTSSQWHEGRFRVI